jgi:hypothetical protein
MSRLAGALSDKQDQMDGAKRSTSPVILRIAIIDAAFP